MKNLFKKISIMLSFAITLTFVSPILEAKAYDEELSPEYIEAISRLVNINNYEDNTEIPDLILSEEEVKLANEYIQKEIDNGNIVIMPRSLSLAGGALAGTFFIPGVGQAVITAAGVIMVGGAAISAGSWLGKKVTEWVKNHKEQQIAAIKNSIPSSLKKGNGDVDLGKFKDKNGRTPLNKNSGTFNNGRWSVEKDTAGHGGRKWKLKKDGKRVGSLDGNGKVLSK